MLSGEWKKPPQCIHCPRRVAGLPGDCIGQYTRGAYCTLVQEDGECWTPAILSWEAPRPVVTYSTDPPPEPAPALVEVATARPSIAASLSLWGRIRACPHWTKSTDCGCGVNECALGKGDRGRVGHHDCFECLKATEAPPDSGSSGT